MLDGDERLRAHPLASVGAIRYCRAQHDTDNPKETAVSTQRYTVLDRKIGPLSTFSAINPRYAVIDTQTNLPVDEFVSKRAASETARDMNQPKSDIAVYAMGRDERDACQAGTDGCCIDHSECNSGCEAW